MVWKALSPSCGYAFIFQDLAQTSINTYEGMQSPLCSPIESYSVIQNGLWGTYFSFPLNDGNLYAISLCNLTFQDKSFIEIIS